MDVMKEVEQPYLSGSLSFLPIIEEEYTDASHAPADVRIEVSSSESQGWVWVRNRHAAIPDQGWKIHLSAAVTSAEQILRRALPVLQGERVSFKAAYSVKVLGNLNSGMSGISQIGKFITVYPINDAQAVHLAVELDRVTQGLRGPDVPSDRPLYRGSLVHYRYGGFAVQSLQNKTGEVLYALRNPQGELVPDERSRKAFVPEWAEDPFIAAGVAAPLPQIGPLVAGRYLIVSTMSETARGLVQLAVDVEERRRCVLKTARRDGAIGFDGACAWDRLRNEAAMLGRLAPDSRFPQVFDLFEHNGDLVMVMEEAPGEHLFDHVRALTWQGRQMSVEKVISWGIELATMLGNVHGKGLVYRDLKPTNVIVSPEGKLRLLDFDISQEIGSPHALYSPGTIGYMSRRQNANEPPRVAHDIYSLGALLYFLATGADPSQFSHPYDPLKRPIRLLNPAMPPGMETVVRRCLAACENGQEHYSSMEEVSDALAALDVPIESVPPEDRGTSAPTYYQELARGLGDYLCDEAHTDPSGKGIFWGNGYHTGDIVAPLDLSVGSAGGVLAMAALVNELGESRHRTALEAGARWLLSAPRPEGTRVPGLCAGEAGIGFALLRAGQALNSKEFISAASECGHYVSSLPYTTPAFFNGTPGRVLFHLALYDETGEPAQLAAAVEAGEALLSQAEDPGDGMLHWTIPPDHGFHSGRTYTGYALGAAGIGDALLSLFETTGDERFLQAARGAGMWIKSLAEPSLDEGSGLDWPPVPGDGLHGAFWGHGAAGIGTFFLHAAKIGLLPDAQKLAEQAARMAAHGVRWAGLTQGYGMCGPIEFLLDMYQALGQRQYLDYAHTLARILETFAVQRNGRSIWPTEDPNTFTPSYMVGNAGYAACLLRLGDPERLPRVLGRKWLNKLI